MMDLASRKQSLITVIIRDLNRLVMLKNTDVRSQTGAYHVIEVWSNGQDIQPYTTPTEIPLVWLTENTSYENVGGIFFTKKYNQFLKRKVFDWQNHSKFVLVF